MELLYSAAVEDASHPPGPLGPNMAAAARGDRRGDKREYANSLNEVNTLVFLQSSLLSPNTDEQLAA